MARTRRFLVAAAIAALAVNTGLAFAQATATKQTATQFYLAYREAFAKAKSIDEVAPWMAKAQRDKIQATPKDQRGMMFEMVKEMSASQTNLKVLKETPGANGGVDLDVEAVDKTDKSKLKGKIQIVKEGADWKLGKESWSSGGM